MEDKCKREDLRVEIVLSAPVLDRGEADTSNLDDIYDIETDRPYFCANCDLDCNTIEQALDHLPRRAA